MVRWAGLLLIGLEKGRGFSGVCIDQWAGLMWGEIQKWAGLK